jgi:HEAT repeat protein
MQLIFRTILLIPCLLFAAPGITEDEGIRRVQAHLLIDDPKSALREAKVLYESFEGSRAVGSAYIEALSANGFEEAALNVFNRLSLKYPDIMEDRLVLEELSWGVLRRGMESTQYGIRLAALIGSYLTRDVRAVKILVRMMRDSNAVIRSVAVQMSSGFGDAALKDEIIRLMDEERIWLVRLEVMRAVGQLRIKEMEPKLKEILSSGKNTIEERRTAIEALVSINDEVSFEEWSRLAKSDRAGMRHFACNLAAHFNLEAAKEEIIRLAVDTHPDVRIAALNAIGLVYLAEMESDEAKELTERALNDSHPSVAITATWLSALIDPEMALPHFEKWLQSSLAEDRRFAAAALSATGFRCAALSVRILKESSDPYVRANVAIGLVGQRVEVGKCCDTLYGFMNDEKRMLMWDNSSNPLFQVLTPSYVRHIDQIPNYPEAIDQMTRLNLLSLLAVLEDPRAADALKGFLLRKSWGITGVAAATLLQEGDETTLDLVRSLVDDPDPNVRLQACLVLAMLGRDEGVLSNLQNNYAGSEHERKLHILEALGRIGKDESFSFFLGVLQEPFQILRLAAASGLIQGLNR